jgi:glycosyltransferase involved in cell wall biosynthesis
MARLLLSVLVDTYNHEKFIEQAIVSVLEQDFPMQNVEILVVDDGSTDRTPEILKKFEPRIRNLRKTNGGQASAFNLGVPECQGEIVAFLDGDDWWTKDKLKTIVPVFEANSDIGGVGHGFYMVESDGKVVNTVLPETERRLNARTPEGARLFGHHRGFFGTSRMAYRRGILEQMLPVTEGAVIEADEWLFTLAPALADLLVLKQPLFYYRLHAGNLFLRNDRNEKADRRKYNSLAALLGNLPGKLVSLRAPPEIVEPLLQQLKVETDKMRLQLDGGSRWELYEAEKAATEMFFSKSPLGHRVFKRLTLLLTLVVPPRQFFRLKRWYEKNSLRGLRKWIGGPVNTGHAVERPTHER